MAMFVRLHGAPDPEVEALLKELEDPELAAGVEEILEMFLGPPSGSSDHDGASIPARTESDQASIAPPATPEA